MTEEYAPPQISNEPPQKKSNVPLIITILVLVLLCCCCVTLGILWSLWTYGDQWFDLTWSVYPLLA